MSNLLNIWLPLLSEESAIRRCFAIGALLFGLMNPLLASGQNLEQQLQLESPLELAKSARRDGDEKRGAILFFQQHMACSKCHSVAPSKPNGLGPNLALLPKETTDMDVVDSILSPSKNLRKGFESNTFVTTDGVTLTGLVVERNANQVMIREAARSGEITRVDVDQIAVEKVNPLSIMPAGQVNQLTNRQQFLDLVRYLLEIRDGGPSRAAELQPDPSLLAYSLPEYETHLDHVGLIQSWNDESYKRGEAIYQRVCGNCHGTR